MLLIWDDSYKIGIDKVDEQHERLFYIINRIYEAAKEGKSKIIINDMLNFMGDYIVEHFNTEESMQNQYGYPKYNEHKQKHAEFMQKFKDIREEIEKDGLLLTDVIKINSSAADWLKNHVLKTDHELGEFLKSK